MLPHVFPLVALVVWDTAQDTRKKNNMCFFETLNSSNNHPHPSEQWFKTRGPWHFIKYCLVCRDPHTTQPTRVLFIAHPSQNQAANKTNLLLPIESWLFNRDPYNCLWQSLYNWIVFHPFYNPTNQRGFAPENHGNPSQQGGGNTGKKRFFGIFLPEIPRRCCCCCCCCCQDT